MLDHGLLEVGPGPGMIYFVQDGPVVDHPLFIVEQRGCGIAECVFDVPVQRHLHGIYAGPPGLDGQGVLVLFPVENWDLFLVNLQDRSVQSAELGGFVVGRDLSCGAGAWQLRLCHFICEALAVGSNERWLQIFETS